MVTGVVAGYRGRRSAAPVALSLLLLLLLGPLLGQTADGRRAAVKRKHHHWKANVIKNHLKNHKSLEGMVRLVDGESEYEGMDQTGSTRVYIRYGGDRL